MGSIRKNFLTGRWRVHLIEPGDRYGESGSLVYTSDRAHRSGRGGPLVEFYDMSSIDEVSPHGQRVVAYYASTLLGLDGEADIRLLDRFSLYGTVPEWIVERDDLHAIADFIESNVIFELKDELVICALDPCDDYLKERYKVEGNGSLLMRDPVAKTNWTKMDGLLEYKEPGGESTYAYLGVHGQVDDPEGYLMLFRPKNFGPWKFASDNFLAANSLVTDLERVACEEISPDFLSDDAKYDVEEMQASMRRQREALDQSGLSEFLQCARSDFMQIKQKMYGRTLEGRDDVASSDRALSKFVDFICQGRVSIDPPAMILDSQPASWERDRTDPHARASAAQRACAPGPADEAGPEQQRRR